MLWQTGSNEVWTSHKPTVQAESARRKNQILSAHLRPRNISFLHIFQFLNEESFANKFGVLNNILLNPKGKMCTFPLNFLIFLTVSRERLQKWTYWIFQYFIKVSYYTVMIWQNHCNRVTKHPNLCFLGRWMRKKKKKNKRTFGTNSTRKWLQNANSSAFC